MAYDQDFFLALAAKGKEAWNAWRHDPANEAVRVTFAGIDFSEAPRDRIDFSGFEFGGFADFSGCKWRGVEWREIREDPKGFRLGRAFFTSAAFGFEARFTGAAFGARARFTGAAFGAWATFDGAIFGDDAYFDGAAFDDWAHFVRTAFGDRSNFIGAAFGYIASFTGALFGDQAFFDGAAFGNWAIFDQTRFRGHVDFSGKSIEQWSRDLEARAEEADEKGKQALIALKQRHEDSWKRSASGPDRFLSVSFERARFDGQADFSGRSFERAADFTQARFYYPPDFDPATKDARIDFTGTYIGFVPPGRLLHWTSDSKVPARLRTLRKIADDTKNHDLERDLYMEERKAERGVYLNQLFERDELDKKLRVVTEQKKHVWLEWRLKRRVRNAHWLGLLAKPSQAARLIAHCLWIIAMGVYWALADYGRSFIRPAVALGLSVPLFHLGYAAVLAPLMPKAGPLADKYEHAVSMVALGNAVPFVGPLTIDAEVKKFLFCPSGDVSCLPPFPPEGFQALVIAQNVLSIVLVFFIGLALRNYFRIK
jgi:uncharacterized protein YjbI with pentapeptide repeats